MDSMVCDNSKVMTSCVHGENFAKRKGNIPPETRDGAKCRGTRLLIALAGYKL